MTAPFHIGHINIVCGRTGLFSKEKNSNLCVSSPFAACLKQRLWHRNNAENGCICSNKFDDKFVGRITKDTFRKNDSHSAARLQKLKAAFKKKKLRRSL